MAADSDGVLKAVVICEGDLHDPDFPQKFRSLLGQLKSILDPPKRKKRFLKVDKVSAGPFCVASECAGISSDWH